MLCYNVLLMIDDIAPEDVSHQKIPVSVNSPTVNPAPEAKTPDAFDDVPTIKVNEPSVDFNIDEAEMSAAIGEEKAKLPPTKKTHKLKEALDLKWPPGKKEWIIIVVLLLIIGAGLFLLLGNSPKKTVVAVKTNSKIVVASQLVPSTLSGLPVTPSTNNIPVTGVMIENTDQARPQSGLSSAGVVFEAIAEGGITRFLALFQDQSPSNVGPIRSVRPYYLQWALGFDASVAHVGGSPDALNDINTWGVKNLDEFYNGAYYHRISSRPAPHNVYTSISELNKLEQSKGYTTTNFTGFPRKAAQPLKDPTASTININLAGADYNVSYAYSPTTNSYNRSEGGAAQIDANTNQQLSPKVVIAIVVPESQGALDASGAYYSDYNPIGSGTAYVFQDGGEVTGTWTKSSNTDQISFSDASGQTIKLNPGQTWITAITAPSQVVYQ